MNNVELMRELDPEQLVAATLYFEANKYLALSYDFLISDYLENFLNVSMFSEHGKKLEEKIMAHIEKFPEIPRGVEHEDYEEAAANWLISMMPKSLDAIELPDLNHIDINMNQIFE